MSTSIKTFERQNCDLSDRSNEKARENSVNVSPSKDDTDIFEEGMEPQRCTGIYTTASQIWRRK